MPSSPRATSPPALPHYAELQCATNFSFLRGASHPEELVTRAAQLDYRALACADECSLAGVVRAHIEAKKQNLHLLIGSHFLVRQANGRVAFRLLALATNREGYGNLSELITLGRTRSAKGEYRLYLSDFTAPLDDYRHLQGLPDCLVLLLPEHGIDAERLREQAQWVQASFADRCWMALTLLRRAGDDQQREVVHAVARELGMKVAATGDVCMHVRSRKPLQDTLTAIRLGKPLAECGYALAPNAEQHLRSRLRLANIYPPEALQETVEIAGRCTFSLDELRYEYPAEVVPEGMSASAYLRHEAYVGAARRFPQGVSEAVCKQLDHELQLIGEMQYEPYFLTVYDIVRFARSHGILCQGRGSAANSVVCYCLGITEVHPSESLLFERFISKERNEPPDIDVDFEHQRREEVIQYLYRKYGRLRAALTGVVISYRPRSVLRDVGKALGMDADLIDRVAKSHHWWDKDAAQALPERLIECGIDPASLLAQRWVDIAQKLLRFPRHLSQHPGGFVIAREKLSRLVPIENAAMAERSVVQWDKDDLDALGLLKVDILALGMLTALRRALELVSARHGTTLRLQDIPRDDRATYDMIGRADTMGVFQIESRAQMSMLPRMKPRNLYDLTIEVAIVRPGPIQGGMAHPYLERRRDPSKVTYPSEAIKPALERTLGVPIFQEQVMQIAMRGAGFTAGEADQLRRAMAAWKRKGEMNRFDARLRDGMRERGYDEAFIDAIIMQIKGFGEYGFPESHAASFAQLAYFSSWLKCHEPAAFLAALLNSQPMGFYTPSQLVQDARRHGVEVRAVDVRISDWEATLESVTEKQQHRHVRTTAVTGTRCMNGPMPIQITPVPGLIAVGGASLGPRCRGDDGGAVDGMCSASAATDRSTCALASTQPAVRLGMNMVRGLSREAGLRIEVARAERAFSNLHDMALRAQLTRHDLEILANADALQALAGNRRQALWQAIAAVPEKDLLRTTHVEEEMVQLPALRESETIAADYHALGLTLHRHPLALLRPQLTARRFLTNEVMNTFANGQFARGCGIVTVRQRPGTAKGTMFLTLEDETGWTNVIVWPGLIERFRRELLAAPLLGVYGIWQCEGEVRHLVAKRLVDMSALLDTLGTSGNRSRDFM